MLVHISKVRKDLLRVLSSSSRQLLRGGVNEANRNAGNIKLVKAVLAAALFPQRANIGRRHCFFKDAVGNRVVTAKSNFQSAGKEHDQWCVYVDKMQTSPGSVGLQETIPVGPMTLLLVSGKSSFTIDYNQRRVVLDGWITFRAAPRTAVLLKYARLEPWILRSQTFSMAQHGKGERCFKGSRNSTLALCTEIISATSKT